jgi:hypothetical protein
MPFPADSGLVKADAYHFPLIIQPTSNTSLRTSLALRATEISPLAINTLIYNSLTASYWTRLYNSISVCEAVTALTAAV